MIYFSGKQGAKMGYILFFIVVLASLFIVDYLARERGWNRSGWILATVVLGPLAIPLIYRGLRGQEND